MDLKLFGKSALITGASRGIGKAIATRFAQEGVSRLFLVARNSERLDKCAAELRDAYGIEIDTFPVDLAASGAARRIHERWPSVDILINNAADTKPGKLADTTDDEWRSSIELKLLAYMSMTRYYYASMKEIGGGVILNNIGVAGEAWDAEYIIGSTLNAGMMAFTRTLGGVSMDDNIRVVGVNPGAVATERFVEMSRRRAKDQLGDELLWGKYTQSLPGGRAASPDEVADLFVWLASDCASYISGTILTLDGGRASRRSSF